MKYSQFLIEIPLELLMCTWFGNRVVMKTKSRGIGKLFPHHRELKANQVAVNSVFH